MSNKATHWWTKTIQCSLLWECVRNGWALLRWRGFDFHRLTLLVLSWLVVTLWQSKVWNNASRRCCCLRCQTNFVRTWWPTENSGRQRWFTRFWGLINLVLVKPFVGVDSGKRSGECYKWTSTLETAESSSPWARCISTRFDAASKSFRSSSLEDPSTASSSSFPCFSISHGNTRWWEEVYGVSTSISWTSTSWNGRSGS